MIPFSPPPEPEHFDAKARQPGNEWLAKNPQAKRPKDYWSEFRNDLADGFKNICAYSVMYLSDGTVDHYLSCKNYRHLAYEWSNYRYAAQWINSSKRTLDEEILDPFQVGDDWFKILLPSLQLVVTDKVPLSERKRAEFTLQRLHLQDDERVIRQRQAWYQLYLDGDLTLTGLEKKAPLIARAVRKQQQSNKAENQ
jgi:hypothetical protein